MPEYDDAVSVGVSASIEDLIVCGHSACGAMTGLLQPEHLRHTPATARWLKYAEPALEKLGANGGDRLERLTKLNVIEQMRHLHTHPSVQERLRAGRLGIHGWFYEIHTGIVEACDPSSGRFAPWPPPD